MATRNQTSKLTVLGIGLVLLVVVAAGAWRFLSPAGSGALPERAESAVGDVGVGSNEAVSDRPAETLNALSSSILHLKREFERSQDENENLQRETGQLREALQTLESQNAENRALWGEEIDRLQQGLAASSDSALARMQQMFGDFEGRMKPYPVEPSARQHGELRADGRVWFASSAGGGGVEGSGGDLTLPGRLAQIAEGPVDSFGISTQAAGGGRDGPQALPVYSIPANATLVRSRGLTAIIGRVPINGSVSDPLPFKIITGADNLMPNDQRLPEIEKAVWSGVAIGDATLQCVTGRLHSVTFVFADGSITTWPAGQGASDSAGIAWISDERGYPCIPGKYVSNVREVLTRLFGAGFASGVSEAFSQGQVTTVQGAGGALSTALTGSAGEYALAQGVGSGLEAWSRYILERARDVFDAVVLDPGHTVTINTNGLIPIDWPVDGRKLRHVATASGLAADDGGVD